MVFYFDRGGKLIQFNFKIFHNKQAILQHRKKSTILKTTKHFTHNLQNTNRSIQENETKQNEKKSRIGVEINGITKLGQSVINAIAIHFK